MSNSFTCWFHEVPIHIIQTHVCMYVSSTRSSLSKYLCLRTFVALTVRTITVIFLTIVGEIAAHQELCGCQERDWTSEVHVAWAAVLPTSYLLHTPLHSECAATTFSLGPCPLTTICVWWPKIIVMSTFSVSSAAGTPQSEDGGGRLSEWHVCTAQRLHKRFNVADMLFCLLLYMSFLISSVDK